MNFHGMLHYNRITILKRLAFLKNEIIQFATTPSSKWLHFSHRNK